MPRKYTPRPGYRRMLSYSDQQLEDAVTAIQNGMSQRQASKTFNIPRGTLQNRLQGKHSGVHGGQPVFSEEEETSFAQYLSVISDWGYPVNSLDFRLIVKSYLSKQGRNEPRFSNNTPTDDWVRSFVRRHKDKLTSRFCQNISTKRADVSPTEINTYFDNLEQSLEGVQPQNILNYDETNLCDNPGKKRCIFRRGVRYPERILNATKASTSIMFACSGVGEMLPPYVVYRAKHLMNTWTERGPKNARYNRSKSGWFDTTCFNDWFGTIVVTWAKSKEGKKVVIGDNLSSHFTVECIRLCEEHNISFVCLPPNSTHLTQPLDVCVFSSLKKHWRAILSQWKEGPGRKLPTLPKDSFPKLLKQLTDSMTDVVAANIVSGFRKTGIHPTNRQIVLDRLPQSDTSPTNDRSHVSEAFMDRLETLRFDQGEPKVRRKRVSVEPGKSVSLEDLELPPAKRPSLPAAGTSTSSEPVPGISTSDSNDDSESSDDSPMQSDDESEIGSDQSDAACEKSDISTGRWVIVQYKVRNRNLHYVGQILCACNQNGDMNSAADLWEVRFLRKSKKTEAFIAPNVQDIALVDVEEIVRVLPDPTIRRQVHRFSVKFDGLNMQ